MEIWNKCPLGISHPGSNLGRWRWCLEWWHHKLHRLGLTNKKGNKFIHRFNSMSNNIQLKTLKQPSEVLTDTVPSAFDATTFYLIQVFQLDCPRLKSWLSRIPFFWEVDCLGETPVKRSTAISLAQEISILEKALHVPPGDSCQHGTAAA